MSKKNIILSCLLVVLLVCSCMLMTACAKNYEVKWNIDGHATVAVEGEKKLPAKAEENSTITFTAEGKDGYQIASVTYKIGDKERSISAKNGKYTVSVSNDLEIIVKTERAIESVSVTTNPTKMTYYTGEELDPAGMVVSVKYKTNETEAVTNYSINYASDEVTAFSRGDTGFTVTYKGIVSAPVTFASPVETKVVLDPAGGKISKTAIDALKANELIHNVAEDENGVVSFTFANIPTSTPVSLPIENDVQLSEGGYPFEYWSVKSDIPTVVGAKVLRIDNATMATSQTLVARYLVRLFDVKKVDLAIREGVPYLDVTIKYVSDGEAYVYLYEGNQDISVEGEGVTGKLGEEKTLSLDLNKLADARTEDDASFEGAWMDIRVNTKIYGEPYSSNVTIDATSNLAEVGKMINDNKNTYRLHYWLNNGNSELKVFFRPYKYAYSIDAKEVDSVPSLVIEGKINTALADDFSIYANGKVAIEWGSTTLEGTINADGTWKIVKALEDITMDATVAGAITFTSADGETVLEAAKLNTGKLDLAGCETAFEYANGVYSGERSYATIKTVGKYEVAIGCDWSEPFLSVVDTTLRITFDKLELLAENDKPYAVITGTYGSAYTADTLKAAISAIGSGTNGFDIQQYSTWSYLFDSSAFSEGAIPEVMTIGINNGVLTIKIDISGLTTNNGWYWHLRGDWNSAREWTMGQNITVGDMKYTLGVGAGNGLDWGHDRMTIWVENIYEKLTFDKLELVAENDKPYAVITGAYGTKYDTEDKLKAAILEIAKVKDGLDIQQFENWTYTYQEGAAFAEGFPETVTIVYKNDGTYQIKFDISALDTQYGWYLHVNGNNFVASEWTPNQSITVGGKTYTLNYGYGWAINLSCIYIADAE